jgi:hypothetical protein
MKFPIWSVFCAMLLAVFYAKSHTRNKQTTVKLEVGSLARKQLARLKTSIPEIPKLFYVHS